MEFKNYYKIPTANYDVINKAILRYKKNYNYIITINGIFFGILVYLFLSNIIILNINILDILINLYYSLGLVSTLIINITIGILTFLKTNYILIMGMWISILVLNIIYVRKVQIN